MTNFFFFRSEYQVNAQGERRMVLRAVPGQSTFDIHTRSVVPVRTDLHVQADSDSLGRIVRNPVGTIWGIRVTGSTEHAASLKTYTRNGRQFYRAEDCARESDFDSPMTAAWLIVNGTVEPDIEFPETQEGTTSETSSRQEDTTVLHETTIAGGRDFVAAIREHAAENGLDPLDVIALSRLRDRLAAGVVRFRYEKNSDGSERTAIGTRNPDVISSHGGDPTGNRENRLPFDGTHVGYFDLQRRAWRSFTADNFLSHPSEFNDGDTFVSADALEADPSLLNRLMPQAA